MKRIPKKNASLAPSGDKFAVSFEDSDKIHPEDYATGMWAKGRLDPMSGMWHVL